MFAAGRRSDNLYTYKVSIEIFKINLDSSIYHIDSWYENSYVFQYDTN